MRMTGTIDSLPEPMQRARDGRKDNPQLAEGDVLRLMREETWRFHGPRWTHVIARHVAFVAFAVFTRVGPFHAARMLLADWRPGGKDIVVIRGKRETRRVWVPPLLRQLVERYLTLRPASAGKYLFADRFGRPASHQSFALPFRSLGRFLGIRGSTLITELHRFFDRQFDAEPNRVAVAAIAGRRSMATDKYVEKADVAVHDQRVVMLAWHPFCGPAGRYTGGRGAKLVARLPQNLPPPPALKQLDHGPAWDTDAVVKELRAVEWPNGSAACKKLRARLRARHFQHLDDLRKTGCLRLREVAFLLRTTIKTIEYWKQRRRERPEFSDADARPGKPAPLPVSTEWRRRVPALFRARPAGEGYSAFARRLRRDYAFPHRRKTVLDLLRDSGDRPRRRGGPKGRCKLAP